MDDDQLADTLIRMAADRGADQHAVSFMGLAAFAGEHASAISQALLYIDINDLDADTVGAYRAFRATLTHPPDLEGLPAL